MTNPQPIRSVTSPAGLGHPEYTLRTDPRSDPRLVAALAVYGMDGLAAPAAVSPDDPIQARLEYIGEAETGFEQFFAGLMEGLSPVPGVAHSMETIRGVVSRASALSATPWPRPREHPPSPDRQESETMNPSTPRLHHITQKTTRLQEMIDWYSAAVGMSVTFQFPGGAWLTNDDANHRLALLAHPALRDDPNKLDHTGMHHSAYEYDDVDGLLESYTRLKERGERPHACLDHGMTMSFYYVDPDGNSVELQYDHEGDWESSTSFMRSSPEFAADPIGVAVDPDRLVDARTRGASQDEIHRRAYAGEFAPSADLDLCVPLG